MAIVGLRRIVITSMVFSFQLLARRYRCIDGRVLQLCRRIRDLDFEALKADPVSTLGIV